jgi:hypothetical protein
MVSSSITSLQSIIPGSLKERRVGEICNRAFYVSTPIKKPLIHMQLSFPIGVLI